MRWLAFTVFAAAAVAAQNTSGLTARELYFREDPAPPPKPAPPKPVPPKPVAKATPKQSPPKQENAGVRTPSGVPVIKAASNLGVRYNVLRVTDRAASKRVPVDPDATFRAGDCVAVEVEPNRGGYLYVFNLGSSGVWQPLLPSPEMPNESNRVSSGKPLLFPKGHCFEFEPPPGVERLLVVITEKEEDMRRLSETMRRSMGDPKPAAPPDKGQVLIAGGRLPQELAFLQANQMIGRDIKIAKIGTAQTEDEKPNAVYAVKTSATTQATDRLVIEIKLRHE